MKILELEACPACGASNGRVFDVGGGNQLRKCTRCGVVSALDYADPAEVYVDGYMFGEAGQFGLDARDPLFQQYLVRVAHARMEMIEKATGLRRATLLDVGSGTGEVLLAAGERGWRGQGVEPERTAAAMARDRGLQVTVSMLEDSGLQERSFDVVSAFHVLEHVPDSRAFLRTMARWTRPGGFVVIEVPNWASVQRRRYKQDWMGLRPREHLVHFSPETLGRTLLAASVEPVLIRTPAYIGPPQNLDHALHDLARPHGRFRRLVEPLSRRAATNGEKARYPTRGGWTVLRLVEALYDKAGVGTVVFCVGRTRG
jgi:2-polyprenyl-3-methyl-5-hydroxy-6-metoxy-1,4-benzoquinol methylase